MHWMWNIHCWSVHQWVVVMHCHTCCCRTLKHAVNEYLHLFHWLQLVHRGSHMHSIIIVRYVQLLYTSTICFLYSFFLVLVQKLKFYYTNCRFEQWTCLKNALLPGMCFADVMNWCQLRNFICSANLCTSFPTWIQNHDFVYTVSRCLMTKTCIKNSKHTGFTTYIHWMCMQHVWVIALIRAV